jgi:putative flavoprotein involved in K+ transport
MLTPIIDSPSEPLAPAQTQLIDVVVIGAGQAGLSVGYFLAKNKSSFLILDANQRIGDSWRNRWDSLRLFTPSRFDGLAGMPFPGPAHSFPTKNQMADYLESYARRFALPVRHGISVERLTRTGRRYLLSAGGQSFAAKHVVVAMAGYQQPRLPDFHSGLRGEIRQMHSSAYRNPAQLQPGPVLLVGAGNSGAEIAVEVARHKHKVWMAGRNTGAVPFRIDGLASRLFLQRFIFRLVFHRLLTVNTPLGRKAKSKMLSQGGLLIRVKEADLAAAAVERVPRVEGLRAGLPLLADGRVLEPANVIWCTGFHPGFSWIDLPVIGERGLPQHNSGVVPGQPGLYFVGLPFLHSFSSTMIHGVARDAERIAQVIRERILNEAATGKTSTADRFTQEKKFVSGGLRTGSLRR